MGPAHKGLLLHENHRSPTHWDQGFLGTTLWQSEEHRVFAIQPLKCYPGLPGSTFTKFFKNQQVEREREVSKILCL